MADSHGAVYRSRRIHHRDGNIDPAGPGEVLAGHLRVRPEIARRGDPQARTQCSAGGFETGPLSGRFYHGLAAEGLSAICIDTRHAKAALDMAANKTDANDADGPAHLAEVGF